MFYRTSLTVLRNITGYSNRSRMKMSSATTIYDFIVKDADGKDVSLEKYRFVSKLICCLLLKIKIISTVVFLFDYGIDLK